MTFRTLLQREAALLDAHLSDEKSPGYCRTVALGAVDPLKFQVSAWGHVRTSVSSSLAGMESLLPVRYPAPEGIWHGTPLSRYSRR